MLFPVIKDLNYIITNFLQMIYISSTSLGDYYSDWKLNSLSHILPIFPSSETIDKDNPILFIFKTIIFFLFKIQDFIVYFFSFKWLAVADFAYLNVSVPENFWQSLPKIPPSYEYSNWIFLMFQKATRFLDMLEETIGYSLLSKIPKDPFFYEDYNYIKYPPNMDKTNMVFFDSYQTISNLPKTLLEPSWFDSISTPMQIFGFPGVEYNQLHRTANEYGFLRQTNLGLLFFLVFPMAISIFFSSFLNSFFINFPLSISRIVSLRYFNVNSPYYDSESSSIDNRAESKKKKFALENFQVSMLSVFGIVFGEICFIFLLILPPPFIQFTLSYLDSIWPYIFGLGLVVFVISEGVKTNIITLWTNVETMKVSLNIKRKPLKVFLVCFLLSLTEQSCCFSYFGSLNFNSTANFFDTYVFSASVSPIIFIFSCLGFFIGSFFAITIYNFGLSQLLYFIVLGWKRKKKIFSFIFPSYTSLRSKIINWWYSPSTSKVSESLLFMLKSYKTIQPVSRFLNFFSVINSYFSGILTLLINQITQNNNVAYRQTQYMKKSQKTFDVTTMEKTKKEKAKASPFPNFSTSPGQVLATNSFDYNSFNLSVYPFAAGNQENQQTFSNKIKNFPTQLKKNKPFNWSILTGIDQFLVICLVIFSFTSIPFYSMDFMVNKFFGFIPQDQILNNYNLNNAMPDYGDNIGVQVDIRFLDSPNQAETIYCLLHELALFDQNNYGNVLWKTNFENLNYRNALHFSSFLQEYNTKRTRKKFFAPTMRKLRNKLFPYYQGLKDNSMKYGGLTNNFGLMQPKKNIFLVDPKDFLNDNIRKKNIKNFEEAFSVISSKVLNSDPDGFSRWSRYWGPRIIIDDPIQYTSDVTFGPLTFDEFGKEIVSGKNIEVEELKKPFAYKYFHNPISKIILSNDLKNFLKHQPLSQQLTDVQEKDLALLRVKMAHYYDSLRFYFNLKNHVHQLKHSFEQNSEQAANLNSKKTDDFSPKNNQITRDVTTKRDDMSTYVSDKKSILGDTSLNLKQDNRQANRFYKNLQFPPMIAKSISSLNYHQQFKGTYEVVRELYDISLYNNNKNTNNIFPEQTPKSENFSEGYQETPESNVISNQLASSSSPLTQKARGLEDQNKNFALPISKEKSENFALPIQSFDNSYKDIFFPHLHANEEKKTLSLAQQKKARQPESESFKSSENENRNFDGQFTPFGLNKSKDFDTKLGKIKEATLGVADSLISRVKNRLYQIDPDLVTNSTKNFLPSNGWLADRKALLSYDKSLFNEYDYNEENFLHEEAKIISSKNNLSNPTTSLNTSKSNQSFDSNKSFDQQDIRDFIKMNKKIKESTNPFYVGWDQKLRKFILTSRIIHRPYYLTQQIENSENSQFTQSDFNKQTGLLAKIKKWLPTNQKTFKTSESLSKNDSQQTNFSKGVSKPQMTEYYSSWPFMGEKITSVQSNKYSGLYTNRRFISDNPKNKPGKNLQTYYYENFPYVEILPYDLVQDYTELFDYYYYKNYDSIKQIFPRLYMPSNILKFYARGTNYKQTMLSPTSSTFLWSGTEDISSNYPISLLVNIEQKLLGYETLYLDQKIKERQKYRIDHVKNNQGINFNDNKTNYFFGDNIQMFKKAFRSNFPKLWYKVLDYQNHITRNFEINEEVEELFWYNYQHIISYNRALFFAEHLYPQEIKEDFFVLPNHKYPEKLRYTLGEIRTIQQGYDDGIEYSDDHEIPAKIQKTPKPDTKNS